MQIPTITTLAPGVLRACFFDELDLYGTNSLKAVSIRILYTVPFIHVYKFIFVALKTRADTFCKRLHVQLFSTGYCY